MAARGGGIKDRKTHAHHIVMKNGDIGQSGAVSSFLARSILWTENAKLTGGKAGVLNPITGKWNFVWAPSWGHSEKYAEDVLNRLKKVKNEGDTKIHDELIKIARLVSSPTNPWYVGAGGTGDPQ